MDCDASENDVGIGKLLRFCFVYLIISLPRIRQKTKYDFSDNSSDVERSEERSLTGTLRHRPKKRGAGREAFQRAGA